MKCGNHTEKQKQKKSVGLQIRIPIAVCYFKECRFGCCFAFPVDFRMLSMPSLIVLDAVKRYSWRRPWQRYSVCAEKRASKTLTSTLQLSRVSNLRFSLFQSGIKSRARPYLPWRGYRLSEKYDEKTEGEKVIWINMLLGAEVLWMKTEKLEKEIGGRNWEGIRRKVFTDDDRLDYPFTLW